MATDDSLIGRQIGGYRILALVGRGGMGSVYRARDEALRRDIALKLLRIEDLREPREAERFRREARLAASLNHPNIVAIHGTGSEAGFLYLAMELVEGVSLRESIRRRGAHPVGEVLDLGEQLLEALRASHALGVVHRDIKPENLLRRPDGRLKVLDFGVARLEGGTVLTRADEMLGTVQYMAPEQILGDDVGPAADLYAAGAVLYELLTGSLPFAGESPATLVYHQLNEAPPAPSLLNPSVSRALDAFLLALLDKLPENRCDGAAEALDMLRRARQRQQVAELPAEAATPGSGAGRQGAPDNQEAGLQGFRFTGRQQPLSELHHHLAASPEAGRMVFLSGEAGIGKSRLLQEFVRQATRGDGARVVRGACFYEHGLGPYMPFLDALANLFAEQPGGLTSEERARLGRLLRELAPELAELAEKSSTTAKVRASLAAAFGGAHDPAGERQRLFDALFELLAAAAETRPLAVLLEDMHWADEASLLLLQSMARRCAEAGVLWVVTYRTEEVEEDVGLGSLLKQLHAEGALHDLRLERLDRDTLERLVRSGFPAADFPPDFGDYIFEQSQGNPLVASELVDLLRARGLLYRDSGVWTVRPGLPVLDVPGRIGALIEQRLDQLDDDQRELLQVAAVAGQRFASDVLATASGLDRIDLLRSLFRLERQSRLIRSDEEGYVFSHSAIREVLYAEIPAELRREYHALVADTLAARKEAGREVAEEELGVHLYGAQRFAAAFPPLAAAAQLAFELFDWRRAARLADRAVDAADRSGLGGADLLTSLQRSAAAHRLLTAHEEALRRCDRLREAAAAVGGAVELADAWKLTGELLDEQRRFDEAEQAYRHALQSLPPEGEAVARGGVLLSWGVVDFERGDYRQAEDRWRACLELVEGDAARHTAHVLNNLAVLETVRGNLQAAWALYERVLALDDADEATVLEKRGTLWNMGMLRVDQERWDEALALFDRGLEICRRTRTFLYEPTGELNRAEALLGRGDLAEARRACGRALRGYRRLDDGLGLADAMRLYGRLCRLEGNREDARSYIERSVELNRGFGPSVSLGEVLFERALLQRDDGETEAAIHSLREARSLFEEVEAAPDLERTRALLAELEAA